MVGLMLVTYVGPVCVCVMCVLDGSLCSAHTVCVQSVNKQLHVKFSAC